MNSAKYWFVVAGLLLHLSYPPSAAAAAWTPGERNIADDTGNWTSVSSEALAIRMDGFSGIKTTRFAGSAIFTDAVKLYHPQHVVRLPNAVATDGTTRAYIAVTQSWRFYSYSGASYHTDGYLSIIEMDADALDPATDTLIDTPGSDGAFVYEEHFNDNRDRARSEYAAQILALGDQFKISNLGDWGHPAKMVGYGNLLLMVGQTWQPLAGAEGNSLDAVVFFDVSNPRNPRYMAQLTSDQLGIDPHTSDGEPSSEGASLPYAGWKKIDKLGMTKTADGYYHMSVMARHYYCHEDDDCFENPTVSLSTPNDADRNWKWEPDTVTVTPGRKARSLAYAQGDTYRSREIYANSPLISEPCYDADKLSVPIGAGRIGRADELCAPPGTVRTMVYEGNDSFSVLNNRYKDTEGTLDFWTVTYTSESAPSNFSGAYLAGSRIEGVLQATGFKNTFFTQPQGACASSGGLYVTDQNEPVIYCPSEASGSATFDGGDEPFFCRDQEIGGTSLADLVAANDGSTDGLCSSLFQNRAGAAPSFGALEFTNIDGTKVIYRGRGLDDVRNLSQPPWGDGTVTWSGQRISNIRVLSGAWQFFDSEFYGTFLPAGQTETHGAGYDGPLETSLFLTAPLSFRVVPAEGLSLFEHADYKGRMVNVIRTGNISRACGDSVGVCLTRNVPTDIGDVLESIADFLGVAEENTRSFENKADSYIVGSGSWVAYNRLYQAGSSLGPLAAGQRDRHIHPIGWDEEISSVRNFCPELARPNSVRQQGGDGVLRSGFPRVNGHQI